MAEIDLPSSLAARRRLPALRRHATGLGLCAAALLCAGPALAVQDPGGTYVTAELISEQDAVVPGQPARLGLRLEHAPHWHTYWVNPGDAGLPTQLRWKLPPGYSGGALQWPVPRRLRVGDLANFGYEGTVVLPVEVQVPSSLQPGASVRLAARADWLVCNDLCIPGGADLAIELPVRPAADVHATARAQEIAAARERVPGNAALKDGRARLSGERVALEFTAAANAPQSLEFFPLDAGRLESAAEQPLKVQGRRVRLEMRAAAPVAADFKRLRGVLVADGGPGSASTGWAGMVDLPLSGAAAAAAAPSAEPPPPAPAPAADSATAPAAPSLAPPPAAGANGGPARPAGALTLAAALLGAFAGGIILNLMPCVFPVLSLKLFALMRHRELTPPQMRVHGAAFALGAVLSFLALALLLLALRGAGSQIGWGFQLQSPAVVAGLIVLFFLIGLNLLGAFEFTLGSGFASWLEGVAPAAAGAEGPAASFATGVLVAVVAAPCTAPFMGAALGFAVTQPAPVALSVFAAQGCGMAMPYFLLTLHPAWVSRLPRPGAWMERLKQVMAFPMFLTCAWLFWVLGQQVDMDATAGLLGVLVGVGLWAWATGLAQHGAPRYRWVAAASVVATLGLAAPLLGMMLRPMDAVPGDTGRMQPQRDAAAPGEAAAWAASGWQHWTADAQSRALDRRAPLFVDFTAAWCITCQANKRLVLHDARVEEAFRAHGVVRLQADWTRRDEAISRELSRLERTGVPVYVLYDRQGRQHILPEILSTQGVLEALAGL
jgi:thiol:disulfide interchange protein DsbD